MSTPQFNSKEEFEAYLNNTGTRLENEADERRRRSLMIGVPVAFLIAISLYFIPGMVGEWAMNTAGEKVKSQWTLKWKPDNDALKQQQAEVLRQQKETMDAMREVRAESLRNFTRTQTRAHRFGR